MSHYFLSIFILVAMLASGCVANQTGAGSARGEEQYSQDDHARYYEEIRAAALEWRGFECGVQGRGNDGWASR